jgi:hypothetical protein
MPVGLRNVLLCFGAVVAGCASLLTCALAVANPASVSLAAILELALAMLWISSLLHGAVAAGLAAVWAAVFLVIRRRPAASTARFLLGGLLAFDLTWILWNRLGMAHQYVSVRPFLTWSGVVQNVALAVVAVSVAALVARRALRLESRALAALAVSALAGALLVWNAVQERGNRLYSMERVREAAAAGVHVEGAAAAPARGAASRSAAWPVLVLGVDGLNWSTLVPLLEAGRLPNLARMISGGACGYLDNGRESLSARIWSTVFSGRPPGEHGILGFTKLVLPASGASFADLLLHRPSIDTFYGIGHLLAKIPNPGLWELALMGAEDRSVEMLWDVAGDHEKKVVVANVITNIPVHAVNGAMIEYREEADATNAFPPSLAGRWRPTPYRDPTGRTAEGFEDHTRRLQEEVAFTLELFREHAADLGIYYTHYLDTASHWNWDFHSPDRFLLRGLPRRLDDRAWEALVRENLASPAFRAYELLDAALGEFSSSFPDAVVLVCSDHGWTYSGYEHFGSPDGAIILAGPGVSSGAPLAGCRVEDVTPTVLGLLGIPLAETLPGRFVAEAFVDPPALLTCERYDAPIHRGAGVPVADPEERERLSALGYLN